MDNKKNALTEPSLSLDLEQAVELELDDLSSVSEMSDTSNIKKEEINQSDESSQEIKLDNLDELDLNLETSSPSVDLKSEVSGISLNQNSSLTLEGTSDFSLDQSNVDLDLPSIEGLSLAENTGLSAPSLSVDKSHLKPELKTTVSADNQEMEPENFDANDFSSFENLEINNSSAGLDDKEIDSSLDSFSVEEELGYMASDDFSEDTKRKLKEIDEIMHQDTTNSSLSLEEFSNFNSESIVPEDLNLSDINLSSEMRELDSSEEKSQTIAPVEKVKKKKTINTSDNITNEKNTDLRHIAGAYSDEMDRLKATISNLREDREELLSRIQKLEDEKVMQSRQTLSLRAELDEKKIEITIIRKKLNQEIIDLKDQLKINDEKRMILEEKNKISIQEIEKVSQMNKIDTKRVQLREKELEQRLELLKADAETQIRNRDLKILELKRKIDSMEFDMESIAQQEKKSVESRFELEDKLEKAIKTLRTAINVLEDEADHQDALKAIKKNIDI